MRRTNGPSRRLRGGTSMFSFSLLTCNDLTTSNSAVKFFPTMLVRNRMQMKTSSPIKTAHDRGSSSHVWSERKNAVKPLNPLKIDTAYGTVTWSVFSMPTVIPPPQQFVPCPLAASGTSALARAHAPSPPLLASPHRGLVLCFVSSSPA
jgi:hypothetical protein